MLNKISTNYSGKRSSAVIRKIVIRRLPPDMDFVTFKKQVSPIPEHDYIYFVRGDKNYGKYAFSRAYINFLYEEDLYLFKEKFDNYIFLNPKGVEYCAVVEFAPFLRIPKDRPYKKKDVKAGTIESCPYYQEFVHSLKKTENEKIDFNVSNIMNHNFYFKKDMNDKSTPLLKYISEKKKLKCSEEKKDEWKYYTKKNFKDGSTCVFVNSSVKKRFNV